jgi:hypothetical protein
MRGDNLPVSDAPLPLVLRKAGITSALLLISMPIRQFSVALSGEIEHSKLRIFCCPLLFMLFFKLIQLLVRFRASVAT